MKNYIAVFCALVFVFAMIGATTPSAMENDVVAVVEQPDETVFYDEDVAFVENAAPTSDSLWMLQDGEYNVLFHDGRTATLAVDNGSWYYVSVYAPAV